MTLNDRFQVATLEPKPDNYGGCFYEITFTESWWGHLHCVSIKSVTQSRLKLQDHSIAGSGSKDGFHRQGESRKALYKLVVRSEFELPARCKITCQDQLFVPVSALVPFKAKDGKACSGYKEFYIEPI